MGSARRWDTPSAQLGLRLGDRISEHSRERAEQLAGSALITLGLVLLVEKLAS